MKSLIRVFILLPLIMGLVALVTVAAIGVYDVIGTRISYDSTLASAALARAWSEYVALEIFGTGVGVGYIGTIILCLYRWYDGYWPGEDRPRADPLDDDMPPALTESR